jgi:hypothetical protein
LAEGGIIVEIKVVIDSTLTIVKPLNKRQTGGEILDAKKLTLLGLITTAGVTSAIYGLCRAGLIKKEHFARLYNMIKQCIDDKLGILP